MDNSSTDAEELRKRAGELWRLAYYGINSIALGYIVSVDSKALVIGIQKGGTSFTLATMYVATTLTAVMVFYSSSIGTTLHRGRPTVLREVGMPLLLAFFLAAQAACLDLNSLNLGLWSLFFAGNHAVGALIQFVIAKGLPQPGQWHPDLKKIGGSYRRLLYRSSLFTAISFAVTLLLALSYLHFKSGYLLLAETSWGILFLLASLVALDISWREYADVIWASAAESPKRSKDAESPATPIPAQT